MPELNVMESPKVAGFVDSSHSNANRRRADKEEKASDKAAESAGATRSRGGSKEFGMNKGGLIKKPKKKKTKKY